MFGYLNQRHHSIRGNGFLREGVAPGAFRDEAARWQAASSRLLGVDDRWTARAVERHLRRHHPDGASPALADDLAGKVREVVRWRRWALAAGVAQPGFDGGRLGMSLATADRLAREWARGRPDYDAADPCHGRVERTRSGWVVRQGAYRLSTSYFHSDVTWRCDTRAGARAHVADVRAHEAWRAGWIHGFEVAPRTFPTFEVGIDVLASKRHGEALRVVLREDGHDVGAYVLSPATLAASRAMGASSLSGERRMDPFFRGRGFADVMHAAAEAVAGCPLVPYGVNGNAGDLTALSRRYYARRVARGEEGAFSAEADARFSAAAVHDGEAAWLSRSHDTFANARAVVAMRRMVGGTLRTMRGTDDEAALDSVWLSLPGGMALTATGRRPEADIVDSLDDVAASAAVSDLTARDMRRLVGQRILAGEDRKRDGLAAAVAARTLYDAGMADAPPPALDPAVAAGSRRRLRGEVLAIAATLGEGPRPSPG